MRDNESDYLVWMDLETSGLDTDDVILEGAIVITNGHLSFCVLGPNIVIHYEGIPSEPVVVEMHTKSGLLKACAKSQTTVEEAEDQFLQFLQQWGPSGSMRLAGSTINFDRKFLDKYMPKLHEYLHYKNIDVSTVHGLFERWLPQVAAQAPDSKETHRAQEDIMESINRLRFYREEIMHSNSHFKIW